jgi:hypothetical protein
VKGVKIVFYGNYATSIVYELRVEAVSFDKVY